MIDTKSFFAFFNDKNHKLSTKVSVAIIALALLLCVDNYLKWSHTYRMQNKLARLKEADELLRPRCDSMTKVYAFQLRKSAMDKQILIEQLVQFHDDKVNAQYMHENKDRVLFIFSATVLFMILGVCSFLFLFIYYPTEDFVKNLAAATIFSFGNLILALISYYFLDLIGMMGAWWVNYVFDIVIQGLLVWGMYRAWKHIKWNNERQTKLGQGI